ncbi:type II secretory pathway pseudopilin PulG [Microbacterium trichothecenolyticum]|uniref:hypothetical protein n=1 Tax=Microbacterium trichothecenolyticum TaxID=69370 RepID=UPI00285A6C05|nr:hypothetical protein [Microbacterium trichothecenolyticum]MDR7113310.1 type II secretory pathway pseudopilin PulG [Microbacterium trichothecenolyticum]
MSARTQPKSDDSGLGLVELIVVVVVVGIIFAAIGTILTNSWVAQKSVLTVTEATNRGQVVGSALERAARNAVDARVTNDSDVALAAGTGGTVLWVRTSLGGDMRCQGFRISGGELRLAMSNTMLPASAGWARWEPSVTLAATGSPFTVDMGDKATYKFSIDTDASPVDFDGTIAIRSDPLTAADKGTNPCW